VKTLDPGNPVNKEQIKASITDAIAQQVAGFSREEIALRVDVEYERLLGHASILTHIPSLTAGSVRRGLRAGRADTLHHQSPDSGETKSRR
jgi:hypothetical protein